MSMCRVCVQGVRFECVLLVHVAGSDLGTVLVFGYV